MQHVYPILLLIASNTFMTVAWYGHLKHPDAALWLRVLVSWLIAFPEYALQVPANALGAKVMSPTQLKIVQEVISISVFVVFAWFYFGEAPTWRTGLAFVLIAAAVALVVTGRPPQPATAAAGAPAAPPASAACPAAAGPPPPATSPSAGA